MLPLQVHRRELQSHFAMVPLFLQPLDTYLQLYGDQLDNGEFGEQRIIGLRRLRF